MLDAGSSTLTTTHANAGSARCARVALAADEATAARMIGAAGTATPFVVAVVREGRVRSGNDSDQDCPGRGGGQAS